VLCCLQSHDCQHRTVACTSEEPKVRYLNACIAEDCPLKFVLNSYERKFIIYSLKAKGIFILSLPDSLLSISPIFAVKSNCTILYFRHIIRDLHEEEHKSHDNEPFIQGDIISNY